MLLCWLAQPTIMKKLFLSTIVTLTAALPIFGQEFRLVGDAPYNSNSGRVLLYRTPSGGVEELAATLQKPVSETNSFFGASFGIQGTTAVIGAYGTDSGRANIGAAYVYRNLDTLVGTPAADLKLAATDQTNHSLFGSVVEYKGSTAAISAPGKGSVYVFRNLDTGTGTKTQDAQLTLSSYTGVVRFGQSLSMSGNNLLIGATQNQQGHASTPPGSAYLFRNVDTVSGVVTESLRLKPSDIHTGGVGYDFFGERVSLSGERAIVTARWADETSQELTGGANWDRKGAAYLYLNLTGQTGTVTEDIKIMTYNPVTTSVIDSSVNGDDYTITLFKTSTPNLYNVVSGKVSDITTMDGGNRSAALDVVFKTKHDWVIGETTDANVLTINPVAGAVVKSENKNVIIGASAGADSNRLAISGFLHANEVQVGGAAGANDNRLSVVGSLYANKVEVGAAGNSGNQMDITAYMLQGNQGVWYKRTNVIGDVEVADGSRVGGTGLIQGNLTILEGGKFVWNTTGALTVTGTVSLHTSFGISDLWGLTDAVALGTYTLLDGTTTDFSTLGLRNWGEANAYRLGANKWAYFQKGSLQVRVVDTAPVPEPSVHLLLLSGVVMFYLVRRPRHSRS